MSRERIYYEFEPADLAYVIDALIDREDRDDVPTAMLALRASLQVNYHAHLKGADPQRAMSWEEFLDHSMLAESIDPA